MDEREAEALYDSGKKPTVDKLLDQDAQIKALKEKIASLSADSTNSSKPPSSDGPRVERKKKKRSLRRPGGQKGHKGHKRQLLPVEQMNHVYDYYPQSCEKCHKTLDPHSHQEPSEPLRHQTFELPVMEPIKTEYRLHALQCTCGYLNRAPLPREVSKSSFGPRLHAAIGYLTSVHRGTRRGLCEIMQTLFKIDFSLGAACNALDRVSKACAPATAQLRQQVARSDLLHIDETGWKSNGEKRWLWVFVCSLGVLFQ